jgi:hypothetical protein
MGRLLDIDDDTVRGGHECWIAGGMAALTSFDRRARNAVRQNP